jgi:hypothetical protein
MYYYYYPHNQKKDIPVYDSTRRSAHYCSGHINFGNYDIVMPEIKAPINISEYPACNNCHWYTPVNWYKKEEWRRQQSVEKQLNSNNPLPTDDAEIEISTDDAEIEISTDDAEIEILTDDAEMFDDTLQSKAEDNNLIIELPDNEFSNYYTTKKIAKRRMEIEENDQKFKKIKLQNCE